ncbi:sensor histidine kinase [Georgenia sp. MJ170]|uniref:sensor histidine kinase n=1 Tax=Georgenia sunbinii TaxID=3117728 RepID=UPI002F26853D
MHASAPEGPTAAPVARPQRHTFALRTRLVVLTVVLLGVGLAAAGATTATLLRSYLLSQIDQQIAAAAGNLDSRNVTRLVTGSTDDFGLPSDYLVLVQLDGARPRPPFVRELTIESFGRPELPEPPDTTETGVGYTVDSDQPGQRWRAITYPIESSLTSSPVGTVTVALPLSGADETLQRINVVIVLTTVIVIVLGAGAAWWLVRRELRPLAEIEQTAGAIAAGDLSRRVPDADSRTEVGRLSLALNIMLAQIEQAFAAQAASESQMRRFVSDASHELRTPLATVRGYGELYRMGAIPDGELPAAMARVESEARRMGELVTDLLQLARLDEGRRIAREPADLRVLVTDAMADLRALDPSRTATLLELPGTAAGSCVVVGDESALRQVLSNILGNVIRYTPAGTPVEFAIGRTVDAVVVEVRDHGPGIDPAHAEEVFERFYRLDGSRARTSGGSGLGLAIVAAIVAAHGGTARVLPTDDGGTTVRLELPAAR